MPTHSSNSNHASIRHALSKLWWQPLLRGLVLVVLGGYALANPSMTTAVFAQLIGMFLVIDGCFAVLAGCIGQVPSRGWTVLRGTITIVGGIFVFGNPILVADLTAIAIMYMIAFAALLSGVFELVAATNDRPHCAGDRWLLVSGGLAIVFALMLLMAPLFFGMLLLRLLGLLASLVGLAHMVVAWNMKGLGSR